VLRRKSRSFNAYIARQKTNFANRWTAELAFENTVGVVDLSSCVWYPDALPILVNAIRMHVSTVETLIIDNTSLRYTADN
jgi:hypothetical protein